MNQRNPLVIVAVIVLIAIGFVIWILWPVPPEPNPLAAAEQEIKAEQWRNAREECTQVGDDSLAREEDRQRANAWKSQIEAIEEAVKHEDKAEWLEAGTAWENVFKQFPADDCWEEVRPKLKERRELITVKKELTELKQTAAELKQTQKWCDAKRAWEDIQKKSEGNEQLAIWNQDAQGNIRLLDALCNQKGTDGPVRVPELPEAERPKEISESDLFDYYPVGRSIRSLSLLNVTGRGENRQWLIQGEAHFAYQSRIVMQTTVTENNGTKLEFMTDFRTVDQTRAVSRKEFQLSFPEDPILGTVWEHFEDFVLKSIPGYAVIRRLTDIAMIVDPRLKSTLTWLGNELDLPAGEDIEIVAQIEKLSGARFRMTYVSGLGVTEVKDLNETGMFTRNESIQLAYNSSLLMDYYLFPGAKKQVGDEWSVRAQDVGNLISLGSGTKLSGEMTLRREQDATRQSGKEQAALSIVRGDLNIEGDLDEGDQEAHVTIRSGNLYYSQKELLVREARLTLEASTLWKSRNNLLLGTEKFRDLEIKAYYEAEQVSSGAAENSISGQSKDKTPAGNRK